MRSLYSIVLLLGCVFLLARCSKTKCDCATPPSINERLVNYSDSVYYVRAQEYVISPKVTRQGIYRAFPNNLLIDSLTGKITVRVMGLGNESQTGLRYKITFQPAGSSQIDSTYIVLAGINYLDRIYRLSQNDTIIRPVYNADLSKQLPSGTYGIQPDKRLEINSGNGEINIMECIRRGMFNQPLENGEWEELTINYKSNDGSNSATNRIDIALYYYKTIQEIPSNVSSIMRAHQSQVLGIRQAEIPVTTGPIDNDLPDNISYSKPRPPCVIIVGN